MTSSPEASRSWMPFAPSAEQWSLPGAGPSPITESDSWLPALSAACEPVPESESAIAVRRAHDAGHAAGMAEERARADQRCQTALRAIAAAAEHLESIQSQFARDRERDLHGLAIAIARQMVQRELTLDPELTGTLVRHALELLPLDTSIEIRLHPDDLATLAPSVAEFAIPGRHVQLTWVGDATLDRGGFLLETPQRVVDGRADIALRQLYERLDHD